MLLLFQSCSRSPCRLLYNEVMVVRCTTMRKLVHSNGSFCEAVSQHQPWILNSICGLIIHIATRDVRIWYRQCDSALFATLAEFIDSWDLNRFFLAISDSCLRGKVGDFDLDTGYQRYLFMRACPWQISPRLVPEVLLLTEKLIPDMPSLELASFNQLHSETPHI